MSGRRFECNGLASIAVYPYCEKHMNDQTDKESVSAEDVNKPIFSASQLGETLTRTPEDVRRDVRDGRFAEMTPEQAAPARSVIFLDMDDVLCLDHQFHSGEMLRVVQNLRPDWPELWKKLVDGDAAANLLRLHEEFNPKYVVSSSWALHLDRDQMCDVLERTQLQFVVYDLHEHWQTPRARSSSRREEVEWWLEEYREPGQPFLILDDTYSGDTLMHSPLALNGHVVTCEVRKGLTAAKRDEARVKLRRQF